MRGRRTTRAAIALAAAAAVLGGPSAVPPVRAECLYLVFYLTRENATPRYVHNGCVTGTGTSYPHRVTADPEFTQFGVVPNGMPNGFFLDVRVPIP